MLGFDGDVRSIIKTCDVSNASIMKGEIKTKWRSKSDKSGNLKKKMAVKGAESQPPYQVPFTKHDVTSRASKNRKCFFPPLLYFRITFYFSFLHYCSLISPNTSTVYRENYNREILLRVTGIDTFDVILFIINISFYEKVK